MMRRLLLIVVAMMAMTAVAVPGMASAANGDQPLNLTFDGAGITSATPLSTLSATTSLTQANAVFGDHYGDNTMYDEGRYIIGANPNAFHPAWVNWSGDDNKLIVNGSTTLDNQKVLEVSVPGTNCTTPGSNVTYNFSANMTNVLPLAYANDGGAAISVYINGVLLGSETVLNNDPSNVINIEGGVPATNPMVVTIVNNSTILVGNDFAIDDITLTQVGECVPPCQDEIKGVWHNYNGNFAKVGKDVDHNGVPDLDDPLWRTHTNTPGGQHDFAERGVNKPYQTGKPGNGDWFYWSDEGVKCSR